MSDKERYVAVRHCKWVDEVIEDAPWEIDEEFLQKHKIDYVAHDDIPYKCGDQDDVYAFVKNSGRFIPTKRTQGISTTDLITRIVRDYDSYLRRNLERGIPRQDLNISFFKATEMSMRTNVSKIAQSIQKTVQDSETRIKKNWTDTKNELPEGWRQRVDLWESKSQEWIRGFAGMFGPDGVPRLLFGRKRKDRDSSLETEDDRVNKK